MQGLLVSVIWIGGLNMAQDYYETLGLKKNASPDEISDAYREMAKLYHPDRNPGDEESVKRFKACAEAFEVLSDPVRRREFDQYGKVGGGPSIHINPFDVFNNIFGDPFGDRPRKGADIHREVRLSLKEAFTGCKRTITSCAHVNCEPCAGTGVSKWDSCPTCGGEGQVVTQRGPISIAVTCTRCQGRGELPVVKCEECGGEGRIACNEKEHEINLPPGIDTGVSVKLPGKGEVSQSGYAGDLYCTVYVDPDDLFERDGPDLFCAVPITYAQAILGHKMKLPLLSGNQCTVKIPPGTRSGQLLRIAGMGMPTTVDRMRKKKPFGDLIVRVDIQIPTEPSKKYLDLVKKLADLDDNESYGRILSFESCVDKCRALEKGA